MSIFRCKRENEIAKVNKDEKISDSVIQWCRKYAVLFHLIAEDEELTEFFCKYSVYNPRQEHQGAQEILRKCFHEAYESHVVIKDYSEVIDEGRLSDKDVSIPTREWLLTLTEKQILAVIAWHFRCDHFIEGSWISTSVAKGYMKVLVDALLEKTSPR